MLDLQKYLESGIIEQYCLGQASAEEELKLLTLAQEHSEINILIQTTQEKMESFLKGFHKLPSARSRHIIKNSIAENRSWENAKLVGDQQVLSTYISISRHTNLQYIEALIKDVPSPTSFDNIFVKHLYEGEEQSLDLIWVKQDVPDEEHPQVDESFLVLEGTADCHIDGQVFKMEKGDFMRIPPQSKHKIIITSASPARAIVSRVALSPS